MDWFLYDNGLCHEKVKHVLKKTCSSVWKTAKTNSCSLTKFKFDKQWLQSNAFRLHFGSLKIIHILLSHFHPKIIGHTLKDKQKNKCVCVHDIIFD